MAVNLGRILTRIRRRSRHINRKAFVNSQAPARINTAKRHAARHKSSFLCRAYHRLKQWQCLWSTDADNSNCAGHRRCRNRSNCIGSIFHHNRFPYQTGQTFVCPVRLFPFFLNNRNRRRLRRFCSRPLRTFPAPNAAVRVFWPTRTCQRHNNAAVWLVPIEYVVTPRVPCRAE